MLNKISTWLTELYDSGEINKTVLYIIMKFIFGFMIVHGVIGGLYFSYNVYNNSYLGGLLKFTSLFITALHIAFFMVAGVFYSHRAERFKTMKHRGFIDQWITVSRHSVEVSAFLTFGFFLISAIAIFIAGPDGQNLSMYMLASSTEWYSDFIREIFNHDSEILARLFSFIFIIFGAFSAWAFYYFSSFILELIDTADRFFKRSPNKDEEA